MLEIENWPGLMDDINAAGYHVNQHDGVLIGVRTSDGATGPDIDTAIMTVTGAYPVSSSAAYVCKLIEALATAKRNMIVAAYSAGEMASWPIKRTEALAYNVSGNIGDAPNLSAEAIERGVSLPILAGKVLADASRFANLEATIAGVSGRHRDTVRSLTTHEQVMSYDFNTGWPV